MMASETRGFTLAGAEDGDRGEPAPDPVADALTVLRQSFTVVEERGTPAGGPLRRTWLDTFDWRLYRAGLVLEHEQTRRDARLVLTDTKAGTTDAKAGTTDTKAGMTAEQPAPGWQSRRPSMPAEIPAGPLRDTIVALAEPRALLPLTKAVTTRTSFRLLNADGKTVARVHVDRTTVTAGPPVVLPPFLAIAEVRGYPAQARRAAALIEPLPGAQPGDGTVFHVALAAVGRQAGDYTGKVVAAITADMPAAQAVATLLLGLLGTLTDNVDGVLRDIDIEFLHDLRVAVRRTRSALKLLGDVLPADLVTHYRAEFKWLGDLTTPVRDLDVHLEGHAALAASLTAATPADLEPLREFLVRTRAREFRLLTRGLRSVRFRALTHDWEKELRQIRETRPRRRPGSQLTAATLGGERIARAYRVIVRHGRAITAQSPPETLHDLRKRCKELRYLLEFFAPLHQPSAAAKALTDLKRLQDCLGEFQDSQVQREEITALAEQMLSEPRRPPAATLLAMGEVAARLAVSQQQARECFGQRFAQFAGPRGQQRLQVLLESRPE